MATSASFWILWGYSRFSWGRILENWNYIKSYSKKRSSLVWNFVSVLCKLFTHGVSQHETLTLGRVHWWWSSLMALVVWGHVCLVSGNINLRLWHSIVLGILCDTVVSMATGWFHHRFPAAPALVRQDMSTRTYPSLTQDSFKHGGCILHIESSPVLSFLCPTWDRPL